MESEWLVHRVEAYARLRAPVSFGFRFRSGGMCVRSTVANLRSDDRSYVEWVATQAADHFWAPHFVSALRWSEWPNRLRALSFGSVRSMYLMSISLFPSMRARPAFRYQFLLHCTVQKQKESCMFIDTIVLILLLTMPVWRVASACIM